jgi:putative two-component system response regulator
MPRPSLKANGHVVVASPASALLRTTERELTGVGHEVSTVRDLEGLFGFVAESSPDLVIMDAAVSPGRDPDDVALELRQRCPRPLLPMLLVTPAAGLSSVSRNPTLGVDDVLFQPVDRTELVARVGSLVRQGSYLRDLEERHSVILGLAAALEAKDPYTRGHSERVGILAARLGEALHLGEEVCRTLRIAGQLHDIGKIGLPAGLLNKASPLSPAEYESIKRHPNLTARICQPLRTLHEMIPLARHHHERFDGSGYPDGLTGEEIPFGARILGIADAFDALTSARSYRTSYARSEALDVLQEETEDGRWDPHIFAALKAIVQRDETPS